MDHVNPAAALAARLDGHEYPFREVRNFTDEARASGLVIVHGASDDLMEFDGAIEDELDACGGGLAYLDDEGILSNPCAEPDCPYYAKAIKAAVKIEAVWDVDGYSWIYRTDIPHESFDIVEDGEKYCRGIVFAMGAVHRVITGRG